MKLKEKLFRITAIIHRDLYESLIDHWDLPKSSPFFWEFARTPLLSENKRRWLFRNQNLVDFPMNVLEIFVQGNAEQKLLNEIQKKAELHIPGHGSAYSEEIQFLFPPKENLVVSQLETSSGKSFRGLTGIFCILPRGSAEPISRILLENGIGAPCITYGTGTGLRDKLGLLRITIPKEKEILRWMVHSSDAEHALDFIIELGRLDLPGRGFIFQFPISQGILNTKVSLEGPKQAASLDQIISALDQLYGNVDWRKKSNQLRAGTRIRNYFDGVNLVLNCKEGKCSSLIETLRKSGVTSSTLAENKITNGNPLQLTAAREYANILIPKKNLQDLKKVLMGLDFSSEEWEGIAYWMEIPRAFSYQSRR